VSVNRVTTSEHHVSKRNESFFSPYEQGLSHQDLTKIQHQSDCVLLDALSLLPWGLHCSPLWKHSVIHSCDTHSTVTCISEYLLVVGFLFLFSHYFIAYISCAFLLRVHVLIQASAFVLLFIREVLFAHTIPRGDKMCMFRPLFPPYVNVHYVWGEHLAQSVVNGPLDSHCTGRMMVVSV